MKLNFRPVVYMRDRTHTYLWLRDSNGCGIFLTMEGGFIDVVEVGINEGTYQVKFDGTLWPLVPFPYDPIVAFKKYRDSLLKKTEEALAELDEILSLEPGPKPIRKAPVNKPQMTQKEPKKPKKGPGGYTLSQLCSELKLDPSEARKILRGKGVEKPQGKWEWPNREAADPIRRILSK